MTDARPRLATISRALALSLVVTASAMPVAGQLSESRLYAGQVIREVAVSGNLSLTDEDILFYLELVAGEGYDPELLNRYIVELWDRDLIDDISVEVQPVEDGVSIVVHIEERPTLVSIDYVGLKRLKRSDIVDLIDRERIDLFEGISLSKGELARLETAIEALYEQKGYRFADATISLEPVSIYERRVVVLIDEGNKVKIGKVSFDGNEVFSQGKLEGAMKKTKETGLITRIRKRDVYNPATFEEDLDLIRELYRNAGYKNLVIGDAELDVIEKGVDDEGNAKQRQLSIIIPLEEGERWRLGEIHVDGNEILPDELLKAVFAEPKGGWLRQDEIDKGIEQIEQFYDNAGYMFRQVEHEIIEVGDLVADVKIEVAEGDQYRIGRIEFQGNNKTQDRVLRRNLLVQEGMVFNSGQLKNSLFKLNQLEFFKLHEEDPVEVDVDSETQKVNLLVKGDEAERTELTFGGGFSEIDGFFLQGGMRTRNFLGRGETLAVQLQTGRFREEFDVSYFVPWLFDKPQNVGIQLFKRDLDFDLLLDQRFVQKQQGVTLTYQRVVGAWQNVSLSYTLGDFEDFRSFQLTPGGDPFTQDFSYAKSSFQLGWSVDRRDSRLEATRGRMIRASIEYAGGVLGGDDYTIRPNIAASYFKPIRIGGLTTVAAINFEGGLIEPFGTDSNGLPREPFPLTKFFLGGESSIRGYEFRSIWVRDPKTGETILENGFFQGGTRFFQVNLEYQFLLGGPFRLVPFLDAGNVFRADQDIKPENLRYSAGIELRVNVPIFGAPLRFIWAQNLDPYGLTGLDDERFKSFDFSIGTAF